MCVAAGYTRIVSLYSILQGLVFFTQCCLIIGDHSWLREYLSLHIILSNWCVSIGVILLSWGNLLVLIVNKQQWAAIFTLCNYLPQWLSLLMGWIRDRLNSMVQPPHLFTQIDCKLEAPVYCTKAGNTLVLPIFKPFKLTDCFHIALLLNTTVAIISFKIGLQWTCVVQTRSCVYFSTHDVIILHDMQPGHHVVM